MTDNTTLIEAAKNLTIGDVNNFCNQIAEAFLWALLFTFVLWGGMFVIRHWGVKWMQKMEDKREKEAHK